MKVFLFLLLVVIFVEPLVIHQESYQYKHSDPFLKIGRFAFLPGGSFNMTIDFTWESENSSLSFIICDDHQLAYARSQSSSALWGKDLTCYNPALDRCLLVQPLKKTPTEIFQTIKIASTLHFFLSNCEQNPVFYSINGQLLNPGPYPHLSNSYEHLFPSFYTFFAAWLCFVCLLVTNSLCLPDIKMYLHRFILLVAISKLLALSVDFSYWMALATEGEASNYLFAFNYIAIMCWSILKYTLIFLICKGWGITRPSLHSTELRPASLLILVISALHAQSLITERSALPLILVFTIISKYFFEEIHNNNSKLSSQLKLLEETVSLKRVRQKLINDKMNLFWKFQFLLSGFILLNFTTAILGSYLLTNLGWVKFILVEGTQFLFLFGVGLVFHLRKGVVVRPPPQSQIKKQKPPFIVIQNPMTAGHMPSVQFGTIPNFGLFS